MGVFMVEYFPFHAPDSAPADIYTLSLHDALPISASAAGSAAGFFWRARGRAPPARARRASRADARTRAPRSEEHTSELQSRRDLVCRLLLEKKKIEHFTTQYAIHTLGPEPGSLPL